MLYSLLDVVEGLEENELETEQFLSLATDKCPEETLRAIYSGLSVLVKLASRQPTLKSEVITFN